MPRVIEARVPVRVWARAIAPEAVAQLTALADQPWVVDFVAAMPDVHVAAGVAVGTVFATEHVVVPGALGGDLGCGMSARRLPLEAHRLDRRTLERVIAALDRALPTGDRIHRARQPVPELGDLSTRALDRVRDRFAGRHLGTLGGGNHFLELDRDAEGGVWLLVHSGSRGLGAAIAEHHRKASGGQPFSTLDARDPAGAAYLHDLGWALAFARENRARLAARALDVLGEELGAAVEAPPLLDLHHNFVAREVWGGRSLLVHRKGAVAAPLDARLLIPGSMGTASYVVRGLGNPAAYGSCSHGAGRVLRRKEARALDRDAFAASMRRVVHPRDRPSLIEEAPAAYRDIQEVLEDQADLVVRELRLEPLAVLKG